MLILKENIKSIIETTDDELDFFLGKCSNKKFKKKEFLSSANSIPNEVFFIEKGLVRVLLNNSKGAEITSFFAGENQFISNYSAFLSKKPNPYAIQALEKTEVIVLSREAIEWGYNNMKEGNKLGRLIAEYYFIQFEYRILDQYLLTPKERYENIEKVFPNINQRVPQRMIASYLGISPVHLSRIKKEI